MTAINAQAKAFSPPTLNIPEAQPARWQCHGACTRRVTGALSLKHFLPVLSEGCDHQAMFFPGIRNFMLRTACVHNF
jgi:hypothetical protein